MKNFLVELAFCLAFSACVVGLMHTFAKINAQAAVEALSATHHQAYP